MMNFSKKDWIRQFDLFIKSRPFEQFTLLLCGVCDDQDHTHVSRLDGEKNKNSKLEEQQRSVLHSILFLSGLKSSKFDPFDTTLVSSDDRETELTFDIRKFCTLWRLYLDVTFKLHYPDKKLQLQRLLNKCLEILDKLDGKCELKESIDYLSIHMQSAKLKK
jgi:hypothetical protein